MWSSSSHPASFKTQWWFFFLVILGVLLPFCVAEAQKTRISLFCPNIPRKEAILTAAFQAGVEVIFLEDVPGNVTIRRESVTFEGALDLLLEGTGIVWHEKNGTYYIGTPKEGTPEYLTISDVEAYTTRFRTSREILALHPEFAGSLIPVAPFYLLLSGPKRVRETIKRVIEEIDHPREHILLRAALFETDRKDVQSLSFSFEDTQSLAFLPYPERGEKMRGTLGARKGEEEIIRRMEQELVVLEGETGEGWVGQRVYYRVEPGVLGTLEIVELGTGLRATPVYLEDGRIRVDVHVEVVDSEENDPFTVVRRVFATSAVLREGEIVPIALQEKEETRSRARKLFEKRFPGEQPPQKEVNKEELVLFLQAERKGPQEVSSIAHLEGPPLMVKKPRGRESALQDVQTWVEYRHPGPFLNVGFEGLWEDTLEIRGDFIAALGGDFLWGSLGLSYRLEEQSFLGIQWETSKETQAWSLFLESRRYERDRSMYFFRLGTTLLESHTVNFLALGGNFEEENFSLEGTLAYQMSSKANNLRCDLEGRWRMGENVSLVAGYSGVVAGEKTPLDDLRFEGFFVGLRVTF